MNAIVETLKTQPLLTLFLVLGSGFILGRIKVMGAALGAAAVFFTGICFGMLSPEIQLPKFLETLGLVIFLYTLGLASGPGFFQ